VDSVGDGSKWDVKITFIEQDAPRGIAHAIGIAEDFVNGDDFVVHLGDNIFREGMKKHLEYFKESGAHACLVLAESVTPEKFGIAIVNKDGEIMEVEEKPMEPKSNLVITGLYLFKPSIFPFINFAAEAHVDRSIIEAGVFVKTDVIGTYTLLISDLINTRRSLSLCL